MNAIKSFDICVQEELKNYVYRLVDPRNGETFYIGRGVGNRVFDHVQTALGLADIAESEENKISLKLSRIREIVAADFDVLHIIHRHGLSVEEAKLAEAVLIDAFPGLTNIMSGEDSNRYGPANAIELQQRYQKSVINITGNVKIISININNSISEHNMLDATRYAWRMNMNKAQEADYVIAESSGIIRNVYPVSKHKWYHANHEVFKGFPDYGNSALSDKIGFVPTTEDELREMNRLEEYRHLLKEYKGKRTPVRLRGSANPIRYFGYSE